MRDHLRACLWLLVLTVLLCSVLYPLVLLGIAQGFFRDRAQGSLLTDEDGKVIGSRLIAQPFTGDEYFQPRPSAASWDAAASGASNWGASNPALRERVTKALEKWRQDNPDMDREPVPADLVMASGSGLDPHITLDNARYQAKYRVAKGWVERIVKEKNLTMTEARREQLRQDFLEELTRILDSHASAPLWGMAGVKLVNVLEVNLAVQRRIKDLAKTIQ